ncbi:carbohydrate ABC transporter permease [uncultured Deinococcus sp.]|uniref:carbohydrate ABC transporter permease n=1 Tax=uncultured Deinococcus sp. TaxID=158789 RepID=UPI0025E1707D|nr:carbohydrate ABC transporter permease [uncultured Deinococcus sp.]
MTAIPDVRTAVTLPNAVPVRNRAGRVSTLVVLGVFAVLFALPLYVMVVTSLKSMDEIRLGHIFALPMHPTLEAWDIAWNRAASGFTNTGLKSGFWNSVLILVPSLAMSVAISSICGYALAFWRVRMGNMLLSLLLVCAFIPFPIIMYPLIKMTVAVKLYNTSFGVSVVHTVLALPILTMIFRNFFSSIPEDLIKAARIDGGRFLGTFFHIILPLSPNILVVVAIMQITGIWNDFLVGLTFGNVQAYPMTVNLNNITQTQTGVRTYNVYMAAALLTAIPPLVIYFISGKLFIRGITAGAMKG